jgi:hypothetical protein
MDAIDDYFTHHRQKAESATFCPGQRPHHSQLFPAKEPLERDFKSEIADRAE